MKSAKIIAIANQKGGVGKTTTAYNLGYGLSDAGQRVLLVDFDPQANLSMCFGIERPDELEFSMHEMLSTAIACEPIPYESGIYHHNRNENEKVSSLDIIPSNINLSATEINLRNEVGGERTLAELLEPLRVEYDYIVIDTNPYLGMLTINALAACDDVIIPVSPQLWSANGLADLIGTIFKVKRKINPCINMSGILLTLCDERTLLFKNAKALLEESYGDKIKIFNTFIPNTVRVGEANYGSLSVLEYDPTGKASIAYKAFVKEVMNNGIQENY